jgi:hypothetical protein
MIRVAWPILALVVCSCSTTIQSNKSKDFNEKITKFYALVKVADNTGNFVPKLSASLKEGLKLRGVDIELTL